MRTFTVDLHLFEDTGRYRRPPDAQKFAVDIAPESGANGRPIGNGNVDMADDTRIL